MWLLLGGRGVGRRRRCLLRSAGVWGPATGAATSCAGNEVLTKRTATLLAMGDGTAGDQTFCRFARKQERPLYSRRNWEDGQQGPQERRPSQLV